VQTSNFLNCVIVDDEPIAAEGLKRQIKGIEFLNLQGTFYNPVEASSYLEMNQVDLLFLDINMPDLNGLSMLRTLSKKPMVIFTTAHPDHALDAFRADAVAYLLKPFSFENLVKAINKALLLLNARVQSVANGFTFIRSEGKYHRLYFNDILFVEGMKDYVKVHSDKEVLSVAMNLSSIMEKLPVDSFSRIHKSYIVNKHRILKFDNFELMVGSVTLPIGNAYRDTLLEDILSDNLIRK
jgi:DNA-binding LytR/AlgR family response regulator